MEDAETVVFRPTADDVQPAEVEGADEGPQQHAQIQEGRTRKLSSRDILNSGVQQLVADINAKRKRDLTLLDEYKKQLDTQYSMAYASLEASVYNTYEHVNRSIEDKLQELYAVLERIATIEEELDTFKKALGEFYSDIQSSG